MTPGLQAQPQQTPQPPEKDVTAADIRATAQERRTSAPPPTPPPPKETPDTDRYAIGRIPLPAPAPPPPPAVQKSPFDQPSLVFVRDEARASGGSASAVSNGTTVQPASFTPALAERPQPFADLPTGTRLVARLETPASSAVKLPVVAAIEYNYEDSNHELVIPAGSRAFGSLEQTDAYGLVGLHFTSLQLPDQTNAVPFEARAIGLNFQPLKGVVTGRNTGRRFLVRAFSGIGSIAAATVGTRSGTGVNESVSNNALLREQLMNNIGSSGDQELQRLAYQQHIVVTVPGNTRFYLVIDHTTSKQASPNPNPDTASHVTLAGAGPAQPASGLNLEELRELVELRRELNQVNQQAAAAAAQTNQVPAAQAPASASPIQQTSADGSAMFPDSQVSGRPPQ
jgi:hypothetical protein